jgi:fluoride exporter
MQIYEKIRAKSILFSGYFCTICPHLLFAFMFLNYTLVAIGAAIGAIMRFQIGQWAQVLNPDLGFPWGTFVINVTGSFLLGAIVGYLPDPSMHARWRLLLTTGLCGGFTTFSTFSWELVYLLRHEQTSVALVYGLSSLIAAPAACLCGMMLFL